MKHSVIVALFLEVKRLGRETDDLPPSSP